MLANVPLTNNQMQLLQTGSLDVNRTTEFQLFCIFWFCLLQIYGAQKPDAAGKLKSFTYLIRATNTP